MAEFRPWDVKPSTGFEERSEAFGDWFDMDVDPSVELSALVLRLGETLEHIFGPEATARAMLDLVPSGVDGDDWRELVEEPGNYGEWRLGAQLIGLLGYAAFGLVHGAAGDADAPGAAEAELADTLRRARVLIDGAAVGGWLEPPERSILRATVVMAEGRRDIDARRPVAPEALAHLGGVKLSRIRNMISGATPELPRDAEGKVLHEPAAAWLSRRECFLPTIWRDDPGTPPAEAAPPLNAPVFVPVARDGSVFHPGLKRAGLYAIGPKGAERSFANFDAALAALQRADVARWRRPNPRGSWGIVAAVEWRRMDRAELDAMS